MKLIKILIVFLLGFFLVANLVLARTFPEPQGFVNDYAGLFSTSFTQNLEADLQAFEKQTTAEVAVVTIESLEGDAIEEVAVSLFEQWAIGKKDKDNGLLILIAKNERKIRIEVGYGLEPMITDGRAGRIIRQKMTPAFKKEDYEAGVQAAVDEVKSYILAGEAAINPAKDKVISFFPVVILVLVLLVWIGAFLGRSKRIWPGGIIGAILGYTLGTILNSFLAFLLGVILFGLLGLFFDWLFSRNYKKLKKTGRSTGFWSSRGGFSSGSRGSSGRSGGGFGGGSSGGGGASGGW